MSKLTVSAAPSADASIVGTNLLYANKSTIESLGTPKYIKINKNVYIVEAHSKMKEGAVGLNKIQRESAKVSIGQTIDYEKYEAPQTIEFMLASCLLELSLINPKSFSGNDLEIDGKAFIDLVQTLYVDHIFKRDQKFVVSFFGQFILCKVISMDAADEAFLKGEESDSKISPFISEGKITQSTIYFIQKDKKAPIKLTNLPKGSSEQQTLITQDIDFVKWGIGGLDAEFTKIFRRAFTSRLYPTDVIDKLGIKHVKGIMLHGPPGTGKTLIARQIGKALNCAEPKIINGPEILNKYVGQSEENIRNLFGDAEKEYQEKQEGSQLHLIIFDEIDAICKQRGSVRSGTGVNDSVVNQLLSKIDGVNSLNNILVIGMTNRLDMIDDALLRPGRFEVQVEIGLPDEKGRQQILNIHTKKMKESGYLNEDVDIKYLAETTKNFSGAEIEGLVKSASSFALNRLIDLNNVKKIDYDKLNVGMNDFNGALEEIKPAFGVSTDEFDQYTQDELVSYGKRFDSLLNTCKTFVDQVEKNERTNLISLLLEGEVGCGKTSLAATVALKSGYPFMKIISSEKLIGMDERSKCDHITRVFNDAYKSPLSIIVLDNLERLIEYVNIGPRFSNVILQTLLVLIRKKPPKNRKLLIIGTTSMKSTLEDMELVDSFNVSLHIPLLKDKDEIKSVLLSVEAFEEGKELEEALKIVPDFLPIKKLLMVVEMARSRDDNEKEKKISLKSFEECLFDVGLI